MYFFPLISAKESFTNIAALNNLVSQALQQGKKERDADVCREQAVSASMVYLFRSMGIVWGVAAASAIIQNIISSHLPGALTALSAIPDREKK